MKKLFNILLFATIVALLILSCDKKENTEPDPFYNRLEIHDTLVIYNDTYIYNPAIYFTDPYKDSIINVNSKWVRYPNISMYGNQRMIIDTLNNISIKYKGGWINRTNPDDPEMFCDCFNDHLYISDYVPGQIIIYDDTIYKQRTIPVSYAIFEITQGLDTIIDTAMYGQCIEIKEIHNNLASFDDRQTYFEEFGDYHYNYTYSNDYNILAFSEKRHQTFFNNFEKLQLKFKNTTGTFDMYLVDVFPYWNTNMSQNSVVYYVYIPDVFAGQGGS
jgi:hypothetical protein